MDASSPDPDDPLMTKEELRAAITGAPKVSSSSGHLMSSDEIRAAVEAQNAFEGRLNAFAQGNIDIVAGPRRISQQTFDDVVQENMEELGMSRVEAEEDAVAQFQAQGVDLSTLKFATKPTKPSGGVQTIGENDATTSVK
jgi:ABC-type amino acid transport substrate-binding protein